MHVRVGVRNFIFIDDKNTSIYNKKSTGLEKYVEILCSKYLLKKQ